jgi:hypothetical protein
MDKTQMVSTQQEVSTQPVEAQLTNVVIRIELKPERIQEPAVAGAGESKDAFSLELAVNLSQPVTIELAEPKVTITLHGSPVVATVA